MNMSIVRSATFLLAGSFIGFILVLSCGDNWSAAVPKDGAIDAPSVDASTSCECPASEPPLASRFVVASNTRPIDPHSISGQDVLCPTGAYVLSGSCSTVDNVNALDVALIESKAERIPPRLPEGWSCDWYNNEPVQVNFRVSVLCLKATP